LGLLKTCIWVWPKLNAQPEGSRHKLFLSTGKAFAVAVSDYVFQFPFTFVLLITLFPFCSLFDFEFHNNSVCLTRNRSPFLSHIVRFILVYLSGVRLSPIGTFVTI
jgi:hypothetical protein